MSRLIVVSNRVAAPTGGKPQAGGLAVAVTAALKNRPGVWYGWSGDVSDNPERKPQFTERGGIDFAVTDLSAADFQEYYSGFANRVLWPILHYRVDLAEFSRLDLSGYMRVNEWFALQLSDMLEPDDVIWVHDYHMMPLARFLRRRGHQNRMGFFLHIPLPPPEILHALPHHAEVVGALTDFDLVGFQTPNDRDNFARYLLEAGAIGRTGNLQFDIKGRRVSLAAFPVGIDAQTMMKAARRASSSRFVRELKGSLGDATMMVGVDRLDYSKGIGQRLDAYERFLSDNDTWRGKVSYVQITPKSRSDIPEYMDMDRQVSEKVGHINGRWGDVSWTPIRYINQSYSRTALSTIYRCARVGLVTPLRDGMNLVAKEYVASQDPEDPGVLILSRFAGAVRDLGEGAIVVNPHETEGVAAAIRQALEMSLEERRARYNRMIRTVVEQDINAWASDFIEALESSPVRRSIAANLRAMFT